MLTKPSYFTYFVHLTRLIPRFSLILILSLSLNACSDLTEEADKMFIIGGSVNGLKGTVRLQNNENETLSVHGKETTEEDESDSVSFNFRREIEFGKPFEVTVLEQPEDPNQTCTVFNGAGNVGNRDITFIQVNCVTDKVTLSGRLSGLKGSEVILRNNGTDDLRVRANGEFTFKRLSGNEKEYDDHSSYLITVLSHPSNPRQECTVTNANGDINITNNKPNDIQVSCTDEFPPTVSRTLPPLNADGVSRNVQPVAFFSEPMDATRIDNSSMQLTVSDTGSIIPGAVSYDAQNWSVSITPDIPLQPTTTYLVTLGINVLDTSGNAISSTEEDTQSITSWPFTTAQGLWGIPETSIEDLDGEATNPQFVINKTNENIVAIWQQLNNEDQYDIYANTRTNGIWGTATLISDGTGKATNPRLVIDALGNTTAVWEQSNDTHSEILSKRYVSNEWETTPPQRLSENLYDAENVEIVVDSNNDVIAVWSQEDDDSTYNITSRRFNAGTNSWGTTDSIQQLSDASGNARLPKIAIDTNNNAYVVWQQSDGALVNIHATRFTNIWETATTLENNSSGSAYAPDLAVDSANNNVFVVWEQSDGIKSDIWSNRFSSGSWLVEPVQLNPNSTSDATNATVATDSNGNAFAVWQQFDGTVFTIRTNRYDTADGWNSGSSLISNNANNRSENPRIAIESEESNDNAIVVWQELNDGFYTLSAVRYEDSIGWGIPEIVSLDPDNDSQAHHIISTNKTFLMWAENDGNTYNIIFNQYIQP